MAKNLIDDFCKNLNPTVKEAVRSACTNETVKRVSCLNTAYPEEGRSDSIRDLASEIKAYCLSNLAALMTQAVESLKKNGVEVLFAKDEHEINEMILNILKKEEAKKVVKVKSMTTEEIELNHFLQDKGVDVVETDLGEYIIQIDNEKPSHIVKPAMHRTRGDIAASFEKHGVAKYNDDPQQITLAARKILRKKYLEADVVISGANYVLAEEGGIVLCTNEGNARFSFAGAKTHIAVAGIEKVIPSTKELGVFLSLLGRSATGQHSTVYTDFVFGAGSAENSPKKMYLIFLDNQRSEILGSEFASILKCIRCGACMNRCPVFRMVTGHAYRATYPGPLGIVLSPLLAGKNLKQYADLPKACSLCGGCEEVCPVRIPFQDLILKSRDKVKKQGIKVPNDINFKPWAFLCTGGKIWRFSLPFSRLANFMPLDWVTFGPAGRWIKSRKLPKLNGGKFRSWFKKNG